MRIVRVNNNCMYILLYLGHLYCNITIRPGRVRARECACFLWFFYSSFFPIVKSRKQRAYLSYCFIFLQSVGHDNDIKVAGVGSFERAVAAAVVNGR